MNFSSDGKTSRFQCLYSGDIYISQGSSETGLRLDNAVDIVLRLEPIALESHVSPDFRQAPFYRKPAFKAANVRSVVPGAVAEADNGQLMIDYSSLVPLVTAAVQELNARIVELETELGNLKNQLP